ncbi:ankyrin repeat protein [Sphingobacterium allocomposti]|uniref:Ankyrin repeat protein n=1 Tax=Sphingobacterium allocomposti TaxID=415956 RepID=A0A5S5DMY8_9SPHI|nr:ankyrin repeat domain-containing protein [Sphingobacterium composti Yoo et al. 2007 non Ten et al. 2007]TYP97231.1 ankyrin repeat protein [Sphingobacterium composti Yoo et al. 2007 non Ten et al. 2007]HLS95054.1 ankyrin repeat domain-containing protein [Sphingobacterium sp.]
MSLYKLEEYIETGNHHDLEVLLRAQPELLREKTSHDISPLLLACYYHKDQVIKTILNHLTTITIHEACAIGLAPQIEAMVKQKPDVVEEFSSHGFTPLGIATHFGQEAVVRTLLTKRADPNVCSQNGYHVYPLHTAITGRYDQISKMLIEAGAEVNVVQNARITPLHLAAQQGNIDIIILLLENGADISLRTDMGMTASDLAFEKGFKEIAEILRVA